MSKSLDIISEKKIIYENHGEIIGDRFSGLFKVGELTYDYKITYIGDYFNDNRVSFTGSIYNISFFDRRDYDLSGNIYEYDEDEETILKIYSTIFKIICDFSKQVKPEYFMLSAPEKGRYYITYSDITKYNKIPGYHRKTVTYLPNITTETMRGIILTKDASQKLREQLENDSKKII